MNTLKVILVLSFLQAFFGYAVAQENTVVFTYDAAGNVIERKIQQIALARLRPPAIEKDSIFPFRVFPNPTNNYINIEGPLPAGRVSAELYIRSVTGQLINSYSYNGSPLCLPVQHLPPGIYFLEMRYSKTEASTYKIIISN